MTTISTGAELDVVHRAARDLHTLRGSHVEVGHATFHAGMARVAERLHAVLTPTPSTLATTAKIDQRRDAVTALAADLDAEHTAVRAALDAAYGRLGELRAVVAADETRQAAELAAARRQAAIDAEVKRLADEEDTQAAEQRRERLEAVATRTLDSKDT